MAKTMTQKRSSKKSAGKKNQAHIGRFCTQPEAVVREFGPHVSAHRLEAIVRTDKKWVNGTTLRYHFMTQAGMRGSAAEKDVVRNAFKAWKSIGIGLIFEETRDIDEAEIRIGFRRGDGAWSYLGRDVLLQAQSDRTMNFGWNISNDIDTAIHEIGHTLGMPHEHQNPNAGIVWDEESVYAALGGPPNNWSRETTFHNIIRKLPVSEVDGSTWDKDSIMHYPFEAGMILQPEGFRDQPLQPAPGLSAEDIAWMKQFYPPQIKSDFSDLNPFTSEQFNIEPGEQVNLRLSPANTRKYNISTFGQSDTVMVLFEEVDGDLKYVSGDDDSGENFNANMEVKLFSGRKYVLRVRLYWQNRKGEFAVMYW